MGRMEKINEQIKREISRIILQEMSDPRFNFVTFTRVDVSKDLRHAKVFFSVLGEEKQVQDALNAFRSARGHIRKLLGRGVDIRYTPELDFMFDNSIAFNAKIDETIKGSINE